jgi:hypothetical protein
MTIRRYDNSAQQQIAATTYLRNDNSTQRQIGATTHRRYVSAEMM